MLTVITSRLVTKHKYRSFQVATAGGHQFIGGRIIEWSEHTFIAPTS